MPHLPGLTLRVLVGIPLCVALALAATLLAAGHAARKAQESAARNELQAVVERQQQRIESWIDERVAETRLLATLPGLREDAHGLLDEGSAPGGRDARQAPADIRLQRFVERGNGLRLLALVDPDDGRVLAANDLRLRDISLAGQDLLYSSRNDAAAIGPQRSPLLQIPALTVAAPMRDGEGTLQAILVAAFDAAALDRLLEEAASWRPGLRLQLTASAAGACPAKDAGTTISAQRRLQGRDLCVVASIDRQWALQAGAGASAMPLAVAALMLLLVGLWSGWLLRDLRRRFAAIDAAAAPVAARAEELEQFAGLAQELFATLSADGRFLRINPAWQAALEYSLAQLDGQAYLDFVHPDDRSTSSDALASLAGERGSVEFENRYIDGSGEYQRIRWRAAKGVAGALRISGLPLPVDSPAVDGESPAPEWIRQLRTSLNGLLGALALLKKSPLDPQQQLMLELAHSAGDGLMAALPAEARPVGEAGIGNSDAQAAPDFAGTRVLVVEDDATSRQVTALMLSGLGCEVDTAENGAVALERIESRDYHLVFMDCEMPVMDGLAATAAIRSHETGRHLPVIAVTALSGRDERQRCFAAGMDDYLGKPVSERALAAALLRWRLRPLSALEAAETIDRATLERLHATAQATSPAMLEQILAAFVDDSQQRIALMRKALRRRDFDALRRAAHELKGASGVVGAQLMMRCCGQLQELAEQRSTTGAEPLLDSLEANFDEVREALTAWTS